MSETPMKERLIELLKDMFQFDNRDLDFGIYKIMNQKRSQIEKFLSEGLIKNIDEQLDMVKIDEKKQLKEDLEDLRSRVTEAYGKDAFTNQQLKSEYMQYELGKRYSNKLEQIENLKVSENYEREIYNHIYTFFSRYYEKGDFISKMRIGRDHKYVIPYDGRETIFHWTNREQHYIKTSEQFRNYSFQARDVKVSLRVVRAEEEKGDLKTDDDRYFVIDEENPYETEDDMIKIFFQYRPLEDNEKKERKFEKKVRINQNDVNDFNSNLLRDRLKGKEICKGLFEEIDGKTLLEKNLQKFTTSNTSDYFIHKNLKRFLSRELDFYVKNEVLRLEDLQNLANRHLDKYLLKAEVIHNISSRIIDFLWQLEEFQRKLWEKKKFVLNTDYIITLDKIGDYAGSEFLRSIMNRILNNDKQTDEWEELLSIETKNGEDFHEGLRDEDGYVYGALPIDTRYFDEEFKFKILEAITNENNLDEILDGLLVNSENYQALNLLARKYSGSVKCIYIDPPYNTGNDEFIYKDRYQHSSWLSMMYDRLCASQVFSTNDGVIFVSIDDHELMELTFLVEKAFGVKSPLLGPIIVQANKGGRAYLPIAKMHEYLVCSSTGKGEPKIYELPKETDFKYEDSQSSWKKRELRNRNPKFTRENRPNLFYPFFVNPFNKDQNGFSAVSLEETNEHIIKVLPKNSDGEDDCWRWGKEKVRENINRENPDKSEIVAREKSDGGWNVYEKYRKTTTKGKSIWLDSSVRTENGTIRLGNLFGESIYDYPKPVELVEKCIQLGAGDNDLIMDFFAGSGTTAHAVVNLNKKNNRNLKFIMVEVADYFDSILLARVKKVGYSLEWENGVPLSSNENGIFVKYHSLEQYEDSLENIRFKQRTLEDFEDYFVKYMLHLDSRDSDTLLNIDKMKSPFDYVLKVLETAGREPKKTVVDLPETFNYLLGLKVARVLNLRDNSRRYLFYFGKTNQIDTLVVWRSLKDIDYEKDREVIEKVRKKLSPKEIFVNGDAGIMNFRQIETEFRKLLWESEYEF